MVPEGLGTKKDTEEVPIGHDARAVILRTYYKMLERAEANGLVRPVWQTSFEYHKSTLIRILPSDLGLKLTSLFNQARYNKQSVMSLNVTEAIALEQECEYQKKVDLA